MLIQANSWFCKITQVSARQFIYIQENSSFCMNTKSFKIIPNWPILQNHGSLCKKLHEGDNLIFVYDLKSRKLWQ